MSLDNPLGPRRDRRGRLVCWCGGYWFPHRKGGGACDHSRTREIHLARRYGDGELLLAAVASLLWDLKAPSNAPCPF